MDLLRKMLAPDPDNRITAIECLQHPSFNQVLSRSPLVIKKIFDPDALVQHTLITEEFPNQPQPPEAGEEEEGGLRQHLRIEGLDLMAHGREIILGAAGQIKHVDQHPRALQMAQEANPEAVPQMRSFDQAGNIGNGEGVFEAHLNMAEIRR